MIANRRNRLPLRRALISVCVLAAVAGCRDHWDFYALREVQTDLPALMDRQWSRKRDFSPDELLAVRAGGSQTILIGRVTRPPVHDDVAQLDEQVGRTLVLVLDGPVKAGKTYRISPENGRLIESTTFRPAWRPYRGLEGEVTVLMTSDDSIQAAVRVSSLTLKTTDPHQAMRGVFTFRVASGNEPELHKAQINYEGGMPADVSAEVAR